MKWRHSVPVTQAPFLRRDIQIGFHKEMTSWMGKMQTKEAEEAAWAQTLCQEEIWGISGTNTKACVAVVQRERSGRRWSEGPMGQTIWGLIFCSLIIIRSHYSIFSSKKTWSDLSCNAIILEVCEEQIEQMQAKHLGSNSKKPGERWWQPGLGSTNTH